jgi:transposase
VQIEDGREPAPAQDMASALFGVAGLRVTEVEREADGQLTVWAIADVVPACPRCGTVPCHVHEYVLTRPRDVRHGAGEAGLCLVKRRWECGEEACPQKTFTESLPQLPPRCKITRRLLEQAGCEVRDRGITPSEAARHAGISWPSAHRAFAAAAAPVLDEPVTPVAHLGIDEHRRGKHRWMRDPATGEYELLADRWQCAMRRLVVSPAEPGGTRREVPGSDGLPGSER